MSSNEKNCKGYVLFRLGVDKVEQFRSIERVSDLKRWFKFVSYNDNPQAIAVVRGSKWDLINQNKHRVSHLLCIEQNGLLSQRADIGEEVTTISRDELFNEYINETSSKYLLLLQLLACFR